jgi:hypothetical protein
VQGSTSGVSTLSDAFLRLQLRFVRETGTARVMLVEGDDPAELAARLGTLADEQGLSVDVEFDADSFSIVEARPARAALG